MALRDFHGRHGRGAVAPDHPPVARTMPDRHHHKVVEAHDCEEFPVELQATLSKPYHYVGCGLNNVYLAGIRYWLCGRCRKQYAEIPAIKELHRLIARALVCQPALLRGEEMRFLRKRLGKKSAEFAAILGVVPETYSRFENEKQEPSPTYDHLVRLYYALHSDDVELSSVARSATDAVLGAKKKARRPRIAATMKDNEWHPVPQAA